MSTHKSIDRICVFAVVLCMLLSILMMNGEAVGLRAADTVMGYETKLFDTASVHTLDIQIDDWDTFLTTCQSEEYSQCNVTIDGESYSNVAIRGKGNTSLSTVSSMDSDRYSFKIEFDHYDGDLSYHGLDKLSLNNIIQDYTYMKDYLTYRMMGEFGVAAPLCSFVYITVNGEDWGLYLAVEGVEDSFLQRNYGTDYGELYKPDSMSMGGGAGNGQNFDMADFSQMMPGNMDQTAPENMETIDPAAEEASAQSSEMPQPENFDPTGMTEGEMPEGFDPTVISEMEGAMPEGTQPSAMDGEVTMPEGVEPPAMDGEAALPEGTDPSAMQAFPEGEGSEMTAGAAFPAQGEAGMDMQDPGGEMNSAMAVGSEDVKLQYIDDDPDSYGNIFDNAKTDITEEDQVRLIEALKALSEGTDIENTVNVDEVIRYFVVHNFVCNGDSYTGSMIHNYYLYEEDGQLSMIPWDYNLAYGTFQGSDATGTVNSPIDSPVSGGSEDRPMVNWIFSNEEYTELYHQYFEAFLETVDITGIIEEAYALIAEYVEKDPTKFCTYEEFELGVETLKAFCDLRVESVLAQLDGTIPSTEEGQTADRSAFIDASAITLSDMGTMNMDGGNNGEVPGNPADQNMPSAEGNGVEANMTWTEEMPQMSSADNGDNPFQGGFDMMEGTPENMDFSNMEFPNGEGQQTNGMEQMILLGASCLILLLGLLVAMKFKH